MKGDIRIPITLLLALVVFVAVLWILYHIMGSPECDDIANTTAFQLTNTINTVSNDNFPFYPGADVPRDDEAAYFRKSPIRLCQQNLDGYQFELRFWASGGPEYQIFYEKFPEGGRLWRESYPWSGGAGSTLRFWAAMRLVSIGAEALARAPLVFKAVKRVMWLKEVASKMDDIDTSLLNVIFRPSKFLKDTDFVAFAVRFAEDGSRESIELSELLTSKQFKKILETWKETNLVEVTADGKLFLKGSQILASDAEEPVSMVVRNYNDVTGSWDVEDKVVGFLKCDSCPEGVDFSQTISSGGKPAVTLGDYNPSTGQFTPLNPSLNGADYTVKLTSSKSQLQDIIDEFDTGGLKEQDLADQMRRSWALDATGATEIDIDDLSKIENMKGAQYGNLLYERGVKNFQRELEEIAKGIQLEPGQELVKWPIKGAGVSLSSEVMDDVGNGMIKGLETGFSDTDIQKAILDVVGDVKTGIPDEVSALTGKLSLSADDYLKALKDPELGLWNPSSINSQIAIGFAPTYSRTRIYQAAADALRDDVLDVDVALARIKNIPDFADVRLDDDQVRAIYSNLNDWFTNVKNIDGIDVAKARLNEGWTYNFLVEWADGKATKAGWAAKEEGMLIALYKMDTRSWYLKWDEKIGNYKMAARWIWYKARNLMTPNSAIAQGIFLNQQEGCMGNSLCVSSHGSLSEYPFYLNESAKRFSGNIRTWRPLNPALQYAGWTAFMMGVPEHPRFYVVGPCFAEAKIWKTRYNGEDTIFIKPIMYDLNDTASNYCYANEDLISAYTGVWAATDAVQIVEIIVMGTKKFGSKALKTALESKVVQVFDFLDPSNLVQAVGENSISWPCEPYKPLTWDKMVEKSSNLPAEKVKELEEEAEREGNLPV